MIIYLDQNKWIELARIVWGKDNSNESKIFLNELKAVLKTDIVRLPLSSTHCMESVQNNNAGSRKRLGEVMWKYSKQQWLASYRDILIYELEVVLSDYFPEITINKFRLIDSGIEHGFGMTFDSKLPKSQENNFQKAILTGEKLQGRSFPSFSYLKHRESFKNFLSELHENKTKLKKSQWDSWLSSIVLKDIAEPLEHVLRTSGLTVDSMSGLDKHDFDNIVEKMPSRKLDRHLMKQVLRNPNYNSKLNDLDDWAGVGVATQYCDVVICENHIADMLRRDGFRTKARIETKIHKMFDDVNELIQKAEKERKREQNRAKRKRRKGQ